MGALFFLVVIKPDGVTWSVPFINGQVPAIIDGHAVNGIPDMLVMARREAKRGNNIYVTTCNFLRPFYRDGKKKAFRKAENMFGSKTMTIDLDIKPGAYANRMEALEDLDRVLCETGLPKSTIVVNSGHGVHAWWIFDRMLSAPEWRTLASGFVALLRHHGLKFDQQCTTNPAGILRLPGTANFKRGEARPVTLDRIGNPPFCSVDTIIEAAGAFDTAHRTARARSMLNSNLIANVGKDAPPVDLDLVAKECPMLADALASGGNGHPEPLWRNLLVAAMFSIDPVGYALRLSAGDPRFTVEETAEKLVTVTRQQEKTRFGWPACATFDALSPHCATCRHRDEGKSPLNFGLGKSEITKTGNALAPPEAQDWFAAACRQYGAIPPGRYRGAVLPHEIVAITTAKTTGVSFVIGIEEGPYANYECKIDLATGGTLDAVIRHNLGILNNWAQALGVGATETPVDLIKQLGRAGETRSITFDIDVDLWGGMRKLVLREVEVVQEQ